MQLNCKKAGAELKEAMCTLTYIVLQFPLCDTEVVLHISRVCVSPGHVRAASSPGSSPLHFSIILILNSINQETPRERVIFFSLLVISFALGNSCLQGQRKSSCYFTASSFSPSQPICAVYSSVRAPSMHFPAATSPILQLKIHFGLLELGCELAGHPPEILMSASLCLPFHFLPALSSATEASFLPVILM